MTIDVGQVVAKKYELVRLLGRGSMGEVWSAHHQALGEKVALKLLALPSASSGEDTEDPAVALARFRFEAQVAARLSKKTRHIVQVTDYGEDDGLPYLVMELLDGEALDATLRRRGPIPPIEVAQVVSQISRALGQAHTEGVFHRDLKPANVYLTRDEDARLTVKLLDFGIARTIHAHKLPGTFSTAKGFVFGTPGYMSPEQTRASPKLDHRCDLWALATIAYQMLTGHLPVEGSDTEEIMKNICAGRVVPLRKRNPALSLALERFFERAFADRVDDRFADAASLAHAFEAASGAETVIIPPASAPSLNGLTDSGSTGTEFSTSVEGEALRLHHLSILTRMRVKVATIAAAGAAVLVTLIVAVGGTWKGSAAATAAGATAHAPDPAPADSILRGVVRPAPPALPDPPPTASAAANSSMEGWAPTTPPAKPEATARPVATAPAPARVKPAPEAAPPRPARPSQRSAQDRNDVF
ncbi:MAG TPA: serine/threonine-protein kinase [Polyangiaceae bacterium]|jgi:serine/threonine-protein kinase|nr:serine/threonine-protein kinase [Polyangiaceae bacterium]